MNWNVAKKSIDEFRQLTELYGQKTVHIRFHGGEPLLEFPLIQRSMEYIGATFKKSSVIFHMNTNGLLIGEKTAAFLAGKNVELEISIDGPKEIHDRLRCFPNGAGSFDPGIEGIKVLLKQGVSPDRINLATTLTRVNVDSLRDLVDFCADLGIPKVEINTLLFRHPLDLLEEVDRRGDALLDARIYGIQRGVKVTGKWFKLLERLYDPVLNYCGRMGQQLCVDSEGKVFLCTGYLKTFGSVWQLSDLWNNPEYVSAAMRIVGRIPECLGCTIEGACAGGCAAAAAEEHGDLYASERKECSFRRSMVAKLIRHLNQVTSEEVALDEVDSSYVPSLSSQVG